MDQFRTSWGLVGPGGPWPRLSDFVEDTAKEGYAGVEFPLAALTFEEGAADQVINTLRQRAAQKGLQVIVQVATRPAEYGSARDHLAEFRKQAAVAAALGASKLVVHAGSDGFDEGTAVSYLRDCMAAAADHGLAALMETHRGRLLNDPWRCARLMEALPEMRLTLDLSHWHVIVDREPLDLMDLFDEAARRSGHVHARVGHEKGAQVPHPGDPHWARHLALYRRWWSIARDAVQSRGGVFTVTPEYGPPPYMNTRPFSHERDADLLDLNRWMRDRLTEWFG
ncbi:sugar phosphate isomerase/epimerase family protein [Mameliella sediminis]|uniref:sugar phosphate isomerase/epimerase family protein n=1 Tax=Mameliella sediminis TaxID=2836866 RepID=UPI001C43EB19|nr:TIM barrel protein [Mameliella sediminis]MBV7397147.1 sugar phosphate isomerase/epimerase [Mameliella sediminis]